MIILYAIIFLFVLVFLFLLLRKDNTVPIEELREEMAIAQSFFFEYQNTRCHYTDEGTGDPVVMIHGLGDSFRIFDEFAAELSKEYRVVRLDLPGFGISDVPSKKQVDGELIDFYASCLSALIDDLELDKFHLIGNSLGGWVSWHWAANHSNQLKSLTLLASAGFELDRVKKNITKGVLEHIPAFMLKRGMPKSVARFNLKACIYHDDLIKEEYVQNNYRMINKRGTLQFMFALLESSAMPVPSRMEAIACPSLVVWGNKDRIVPVSHAALFDSHLAKSEVLIYDKCGHYPQIERKDDLLKDWKTFIAR